MLREHGVSLSPEGYANEISGRSNVEIVGRLLPHLEPELAEQLWDDKEARFRGLAKGLATPAGLVELVTSARSQQLRLAIVTNAPRANATHVALDLGLQAAFAGIVAVEDVVHPKPHPEPYLRGAALLDLAPERCLAFEDSPSGVRAAVSAGMPVVGLTTGHSSEQLLDAGATLVVPDFADPRVAQLLDRWRLLDRSQLDGSLPDGSLQ